MRLESEAAYLSRSDRATNKQLASDYLLATKRPLATNRRGLVLVMVLIVVAILTMGAYSYVELMRTHREATVLSGRQLQTRLIADSGIDYTRSFLSLPVDNQREAGGLYNNPERFQKIVVLPHLDPLHRGCFSVVAPALDSEDNLAGVRFGLEDESTRLNLNTLLLLEKQQQGAGRQLLMALPSMTESTADAILDWLDPDDEPREFGAERDYYDSLEPAYAPKNGPLDTIEELLRVKDVTPQLLFGRDVNRNGQVDPSEAAIELEETPASSSSTSENANAGSLDRGWASYLTLYSREKNYTPDGTPRVYLNQPDMQKLHDELSEVFPADWVTYIVAYRLGTPATGQNGAPASSRPLDLTKQPRTKLTQVLDLVGSSTSVTFAGEPRATVIASPFTSDLGAMNVYLPRLFDYVTVNPADSIPGRVNILQAPAALVRGIPGMDPEIADQILNLREAEITEEKPNRRHESWLLTEAVVTLDQMKLLQPFICSGGQVYRAQVVAYLQNGEAASRQEAIFDATGSLPRVLLWRDMSHLGRGYALETLGLDFSEFGTE